MRGKGRQPSNYEKMESGEKDTAEGQGYKKGTIKLNSLVKQRSLKDMLAWKCVRVVDWASASKKSLNLWRKMTTSWNSQIKFCVTFQITTTLANDIECVHWQFSCFSTLPIYVVMYPINFMVGHDWSSIDWVAVVKPVWELRHRWWFLQLQ